MLTVWLFSSGRQRPENRTAVAVSERQDTTTASLEDEGRKKLPLVSSKEEAKPFGLTLSELTPGLAASYKLEGSSTGAAGPFTTISEGPLNLPNGRNAGGNTTALVGTYFQELSFLWVQDFRFRG